MAGRVICQARALRNAYVAWLRSLPLLLGILILVGEVALAVWPLIDSIRDLAELSHPQEAMIACVRRYGIDRDAQAFERCVAAPAPVPFFLRNPPVTALVIGVLTAPLAWRWLRPRHVPTRPGEEDADLHV